MRFHAYILHLEYNFILIITVVSQILSIDSSAQNKPDSPVFRNYREQSNGLPSYRTNFSNDWNEFSLIREANSGRASSQHELGLRYLFGQGFAKDTVKAIYWIQKSASQNYAMANYNLGLLHYNGWGVEWNPFMAFHYFQSAADAGINESQYALGIIYTDNLIVQRNWITAYQYFLQASDAHFIPAKEAIQELITKGFINANDTAKLRLKNRIDEKHPDSSIAQNTQLQKKSLSTKSQSANQSWTPIFLDFHPDTSNQKIDDSTLLHEVFSTCHVQTSDSLALVNCIKYDTNGDSLNLHEIYRAANVGNPDALVFLGRCYEKGIILKQNSMTAAEYYLQAMFHDAIHAPKLLLDLIRKNHFEQEMKSQALKNDPVSSFVWSGLVFLEIDHQISEQQALQLLQSAVEKNHEASILQLGQFYFTGKHIQQDHRKAIETWQRAVRLGSQEAQVRIAATLVLGGSLIEQYDTELTILQDASKLGSTIAKTALGYCYEMGRGVRQNKFEAVKLFKECAQHGNQSAYNELKKMYDNIRPADRMFQMQND